MRVYRSRKVHTLDTNKQTNTLLLVLLYLHQDMSHPSSFLIYHSHKITRICTRCCELDDTITYTHVKTRSPLSSLPPSLHLIDFSPLDGCPLAAAFDNYSTLTSAYPYQH